MGTTQGNNAREKPMPTTQGIQNNNNSLNPYLVRGIRIINKASDCGKKPRRDDMIIDNNRKIKPNPDKRL